MPIQIIRNDITKVKCDAIVNAATTSLLGGGGVDGAIHKAAGSGLLSECRTLGGCKVGQAKITGAHKLPARFVIHTVGPKWKGGASGEKEQLESCYRECLRLALENQCESIAFPLISSGVHDYPKDQALRIAIDMISGFLLDHDMLVYIVVFDKSSFQISEKLFADISSYIDDKYAETNFEWNRTRRDESGESRILESPHILGTSPAQAPFAPTPKKSKRPTKASFLPPSTTQAPSMSMPRLTTLEDMVNQLDESFSQMLLRKINEKNMTDAECYKKANIDRKLFSKIRSNVNYRPSKTTALAFAIALELSLEETREMLMKAGFALSHSNKFDIIIEYFIVSGNYDIFQINEALFAFDQSLLGA